MSMHTYPGPRPGTIFVYRLICGRALVTPNRKETNIEFSLSICRNS